MAEVTSRANLIIDVTGQEKIDALKAKVDELKTAGENLRKDMSEGGGFGDPQALRQNVNEQLQATRDLGYATKGFTEERDKIISDLPVKKFSDATQSARDEAAKLQNEWYQIKQSGGDATEAWEKYSAAAHKSMEMRQAEREEWRKELPPPVPTGERPPAVKGAAELLGKGEAPGEGRVQAVVAEQAAREAATALAALSFAATIAAAGMKAFGIASEAAGEAAREVIETQAEAERKGIDYRQAREERLAAGALLGEKGMVALENRLDKSFKEGGKALTEDWEKIGFKPGEEARPSGIEFLKQAAERRAALVAARDAEAIGSEARKAAQIQLDEWGGAMSRRAGPLAKRIAEEQSEESIQKYQQSAKKVADAFQTEGDKEGAQRVEQAKSEAKNVSQSWWQKFGEAAGPGVATVLEAYNKRMIEGGPPLAEALGRVFTKAAEQSAYRISGAEEDAHKEAYKNIKSFWPDMLSSIFATPAAAAELPQLPLDKQMAIDSAQQTHEALKGEMEKDPVTMQPPDVGELKQAVADSEIQLPDVQSQINDAFAQIDASSITAPITEAGSQAFQAIDTSAITSQISSAGSELGSTAAAGIEGAGSTGGASFASAAEGGINSAGSSGGQAFASAAQAGITAAGSAGGAAFASAINPGAIGSAIGAAAAAAISAAKVNVNVNVAGGSAGGASTGKDSAT